MRIISYNVNGIRAAMKKGFAEWLSTNPADIICLQEIKADEDNIPVAAMEEAGYSIYHYSAQKKGYSGVAILSRIPIDHIEYGTGIEQSDFEGRVIRADIGDISIISAYYPSGTSGDERQTYKYQWLAEFHTYLKTLRATRNKLVVCGDYNIAHTPIDIHDPKGNKNSSGFLSEERAWMDSFLADNFIDTFRHKHPEEPHQYTWWSQRFPSVRLQNKGWRIDYICITDNLKDSIEAAAIYPDVKHSDHCPIYVSMAL